MGRHIFLSVLAFSIIAVIIGVFVLPGKQTKGVYLPWQVTITPDGASRVLGVELGRTSLGDAELAFSEPAEVSLFARDDGSRVVEAYFDNVDISGIRARIVLVMAMEKAEVDAMYDRGIRIANMGGGRHKVTLSDEDMTALRLLPIGSMTYIPKANLDEELVLKRFGEPAARIPEAEGNIVHWLYPEKGLDIALNPEGKEVFQYVLPEQFDSIQAPLMKAAGQQL